MKQLRLAFREELADAGLRLDDGNHQEEAREDFRFLRRWRRTVDSVSSKVGLTVIMAIVGGVMWLIAQGIQVFRAANGT
jgi:hypothetical protein